MSLVSSLLGRVLLLECVPLLDEASNTCKACKNAPAGLARVGSLVCRFSCHPHRVRCHVCAASCTPAGCNGCDLSRPPSTIQSHLSFVLPPPYPPCLLINVHLSNFLFSLSTPGIKTWHWSCEMPKGTTTLEEARGITGRGGIDGQRRRAGTGGDITPLCFSVACSEGATRSASNTARTNTHAC